MGWGGLASVVWSSIAAGFGVDVARCMLMIGSQVGMYVGSWVVGCAVRRLLHTCVERRDDGVGRGTVD